MGSKGGKGGMGGKGGAEMWGCSGGAGKGRGNLLPNYFNSIHFAIGPVLGSSVVRLYVCVCMGVFVWVCVQCVTPSSLIATGRAIAKDTWTARHGVALRFSSLAMKQINCKSFSKYFHKTARWRRRRRRRR